MKKLILLFTFLGIASGIFAQVSKTVNVATSGTLFDLLFSNELAIITNLTLTGTIDARDFKTMRDNMPLLAVLDLGEATIAAYNGAGGTGNYLPNYPANTIPANAFLNKTWQGKISLTSIVFPVSLTAIGEYSFYSCNGLTSLVIPSSVASIGSYAFSLCQGLTAITIPISVTSIGVQAFSHFNGLITVDPDNLNYSSSNGVLFNKTQTELIQCPVSKTGYYAIPPSVTTIGNNAFFTCRGLTSVTIPSSVTSIGKSAFDYCSGLTSVTIPSSVTSIGSYAFDYCSGLTSVTIPSSITTISESTFIGCSNITSVTIPNSVITIGIFVFYGCSRLTSVSIPSSVTSIGSYAFYNCTGLTSITTSRITPIDLSSSSNIFKYIDKTTCTLYVPVGSKSAYQVADQWKDFTNIVEKDFTGIDPMISDQKLTIYPNPTTGKIKIVFDQIPIKGTTLTVNDFTGKTILTRSIRNKEEVIDLKGNSPGVYLIRTDMKDFKVQKVILK